MCPRYNDKCVKVIERKGAEVLVTRDCLSNLEGFRIDIPADKDEGCRPANRDVQLGFPVLCRTPGNRCLPHPSIPFQMILFF